jgi:hypothetical protein
MGASQSLLDSAAFEADLSDFFDDFFLGLPSIEDCNGITSSSSLSSSLTAGGKSILKAKSSAASASYSSGGI